MTLAIGGHQEVNAANGTKWQAEVTATRVTTTKQAFEQFYSNLASETEARGDRYATLFPQPPQPACASLSCTANGFCHHTAYPAIPVGRSSVRGGCDACTIDFPLPSPHKHVIARSQP